MIRTGIFSITLAFVFTVGCLICQGSAYCQQPDTLIKKLDSLTAKSDSVKENNTAISAYNDATRITPSTYFILLGSDLKQAFTKPFHLKRRDWKYLGIGAASITALTFADRPVQKFALRIRNDNPGLQKVSKQVTNFGGPYEFYTLGALGAYGFIFKNEKMKTTTLLASQAYITGAAVESVLKYLTGRTRPTFYAPGVVARPTFKGPFATSRDYLGAKTNSSFPSGHTTVAFAAATVYALEYKNKPFIPILCYSVATMIGLSRITENKHWLSDVVSGAVLGYLSGGQVVNNYHRYATLKSPRRKGSIAWNVGYNHGLITPSVTYHFR